MQFADFILKLFNRISVYLFRILKRMQHLVTALNRKHIVIGIYLQYSMDSKPKSRTLDKLVSVEKTNQRAFDGGLNQVSIYMFYFFDT